MKNNKLHQFKKKILIIKKVKNQIPLVLVEMLKHFLIKMIKI